MFFEQDINILAFVSTKIMDIIYNHPKFKQVKLTHSRVVKYDCIYIHESTLFDDNILKIVKDENYNRLQKQHNEITKTHNDIMKIIDTVCGVGNERMV